MNKILLSGKIKLMIPLGTFIIYESGIKDLYLKINSSSYLSIIENGKIHIYNVDDNHINDERTIKDQETMVGIITRINNNLIR